LHTGTVPVSSQIFNMEDEMKDQIDKLIEEAHSIYAKTSIYEVLALTEALPYSCCRFTMVCLIWRRWSDISRFWMKSGRGMVRRIMLAKNEVRVFI
jgi:hypothetical protein